MVEWHYSGEADITIGEVHISKTAKIILICLIIAIIAIIGLGIYFRHYIYDFIANPEILLSSDEVDLEVYSDFDPESYIKNKNDGYEYEIENADSVDTSKLGTYNVKYKSHNRVKSTEITMKVNVVDTTAPVITLSKDALMLSRGEETKNFRARNYLESVEDNYTSKENIIVEWTNVLNFDKDEVEVIYSAQDEAGNTSTAKLTILVFDTQEEIEKALEEERKRQEAENTTEDTTEDTTEKTTNKPTTQHTEAPQTEAPTTAKPTESPTEAPRTEAPTTTEAPTEAPTTTEAPKPEPYIYGVHDITVPVGTDYNTMLLSLMSGVSGSGYVQCDYSAVNLNVPGTYRVNWSSDDGVSKVSYVTVTE